MTLKQWNALVPGDILLQRHNKVPRMILNVSQNPALRGQSVTLYKLNGSWTDPCPFTVYAYGSGGNQLFTLPNPRRRGRVSANMLKCPTHGIHPIPNGQPPKRNMQWATR